MMRSAIILLAAWQLQHQSHVEEKVSEQSRVVVDYSSTVYSSR